MEHPLRHLFIDFDAWFASVEVALNPALNGKPVAVVPVMTDRTCCIATNYAAKALGIKTGTSVWEAREICPHLHLVPSNTARYVQYHQKMINAIERCIPVHQVVSIDEMDCLLTGWSRQSEAAIQIARQIKTEIHTVLDVQCSIGIAPNRFLAKMASKLDKPDGLQVLHSRQLPQAFDNIPLDSLTGIGRSMEQRLLKVGVTDTNALYQLNRKQMRSIWGSIEGELFFDELRGFETYRPPTQRGSVSHSHVLAPEKRHPVKALAITHKMLQKAAFRMRELGYHARGMGLSIRLGNSGQRHRWNGHCRFAALNDTCELTRVMKTLWQQCPAHDTVIAVGVQLYDLLPDQAISGDLFSSQSFSKPHGISHVIDEINKKYGAQSAFFGGAKNGQDGAPMRIAFTQIPDVVLESDSKAILARQTPKAG